MNKRILGAGEKGHRYKNGERVARRIHKTRSECLGLPSSLAVMPPCTP